MSKKGQISRKRGPEGHLINGDIDFGNMALLHFKTVIENLGCFI